MDAILLRGANYLRFSNSDPYAPTGLKPRPIRYFNRCSHGPCGMHSPHITKHHPSDRHQIHQPTAICYLRAIINPTLSPSTTALRVGAGLEPRVPPATVTPLPDTRMLCSTLSTGPVPASLYPQNATTSINATSRAHICAIWFVHQWVTCNNNLFAPLADREPDDPADHASTNCSPKNVTIITSNQVPAHSQLLAQPITCRIVLVPRPASTCPTHSTVAPQILCSSRAIPVPSLLPPLNNIHNNHATNASTHQHQVYLHPYQLKNPPELHLSHLPLLPPFFHLPNQVSCGRVVNVTL
jgi:hypothetical protein